MNKDMRNVTGGKVVQSLVGNQQDSVVCSEGYRDNVVMW